MIPVLKNCRTVWGTKKNSAIDKVEIMAQSCLIISCFIIIKQYQTIVYQYLCLSFIVLRFPCFSNICGFRACYIHSYYVTRCFNEGEILLFFHFLFFFFSFLFFYFSFYEYTGNCYKYSFGPMIFFNWIGILNNAFFSYNMNKWNHS